MLILTFIFTKVKICCDWSILFFYNLFGLKKDKIEDNQNKKVNSSSNDKKNSFEIKVARKEINRTYSSLEKNLTDFNYYFDDYEDQNDIVLQRGNCHKCNHPLFNPYGKNSDNFPQFIAFDKEFCYRCWMKIFNKVSTNSHRLV